MKITTRISLDSENHIRDPKKSSWNDRSSTLKELVFTRVPSFMMDEFTKSL